MPREAHVKGKKHGPQRFARQTMRFYSMLSGVSCGRRKLRLSAGN